MFKSNRGQLSIFLGITLVLVMGMLAFIINVGLFVKAKINLQNSVDAAAYAGASVQARQLTNIAYLNWEMRNNYKEWLFKYYVIGELSSLRATNSAGGTPFPLQKSLSDGSPTVNFTLRTLNAVTSTGGDLNIGGMAGYNPGEAAYDRYNIPSICLHNSSANDICPSYVVPGLPRFPAIGVAGISEIHETAVNELVTEKSKNCAARSKENFEAALVWAYGDGKPIANLPPLLAAERPGAWMRAVELSMRMRNLEMVVNSPPVRTGITRANVEELTEVSNTESNMIGLHERTYKAFFSAYKNLGGGKYKVSGNDELASNFTLHELAPTPLTARADSISGYFIPASNADALKKYYLDLQPIVLNLATMYSTFTSSTTDLTSGATGVVSEGTCGISKTAMPVPGYVVGFQKNPKVMTYYAVKGESKFIGLFSPFGGTASSDGVKLTAYAAAKPFGGRIGPRLFKYDADQTVMLRSGDRSMRGKSFIYGLNNHSKPFNPGEVIPADPTFWVNTSIGGAPILGGVPSSDASATPYFGIPNMVYDYIGVKGSQTDKSGSGATVIEINRRDTSGAPINEGLGLYELEQYKAFVSSLGPPGNPFLQTSGTIKREDVINAIVKARRVTRYDLANYLVPDFSPTNSPFKQSEYPFVVPTASPPPGSPDLQPYKLYAPLYNNNRLLFKTKSEIQEVLRIFITAMDPSVQKFLHGLYLVAQKIHNTSAGAGTGTGANNLNDKAALTIHAKGLSTSEALPNPALNDANCAAGIDIASKFAFFFKFTPSPAKVCQVKPLILMALDYIDNISLSRDSEMHFYTDYYIGSADAVSQNNLFSAYAPGVRQGVSDGIINNPIGASGAGSGYHAKRNYYSTKFVRLAYVTNAADSGGGKVDQPIVREFVDDVPDDLIGELPTNLLPYDPNVGFDSSEFYKRF